MARQNTRSRPAAGGPSAPWFSPGMTNDLGGQQFAIAAEGAAVLLHGMEEMHRIQHLAAEQATRRHAAAAARMRATPAAADLLAVQSELLRADFEEATRCWEQLVDEALEIHSELLACATRLVNTEDVFAAAQLLRV